MSELTTKLDNLKPRILIAVPCGETLEVEFIKSLFRLQTVGNCSIEFINGSLIYVARERFCDKALRDGYDYVLWLDSDMVFEPSLLKQLIEDDKDMVCGLYFTRKFPILPTIFKTCKIGIDGNEAEQYIDYPKDEIFEIEACGFGGVLVKTKVLEDVVKRYRTAFTPVLGGGEDIAFCVRARDCGYKIYCDSRVKMGHIMRTLSTEQSYLFAQK